MPSFGAARRPARDALVSPVWDDERVEAASKAGGGRTTRLALDKVVIGGEADGGAAVGHVDLAVDPVEVGVDGAWADEEAFGDLRVRQPGGNEPQDLDLRGGRPGVRRHARRGAGQGRVLGPDRAAFRGISPIARHSPRLSSV